MENTKIATKNDAPELAYIDSIARLMDNKFRIPGTNIRFGADFLIGLVPYAGDLVSFGISGFLILAMARHGASGRIVAKMIGNVALDTVVGAVPIVGDIFDLTFKANRRNYNLLREHYEEGKHQGNAWPVVIGILVVLLLVFVLMVYLIYSVAVWLGGLIFG